MPIFFFIRQFYRAKNFHFEIFIGRKILPVTFYRKKNFDFYFYTEKIFLFLPPRSLK
jgi:hypothetical protein